MEQKKIELGWHPLLNAAIFIAINLMIYALAFALMSQKHAVSLIAVGYFVFLGAVVMSPFIVGLVFALLFLTFPFHKTKKAIRTFGLNPSWYINAVGFLAIDENKRKMILNGELYDFDDVKSINVVPRRGLANSHISINMRIGNIPVKKIGFWSQAQAEQFFQRLINALNFS